MTVLEQLEQAYAEMERLARPMPPHARRVVAPVPDHALHPGYTDRQITRRCDCCSGIRVNGMPRNLGPAVAHWSHRNGNVTYLCQHCLDWWFDNADDDPDLEPAEWGWLPGHGSTRAAEAVIADFVRDPRHHDTVVQVIRREARRDPGWLYDLVRKENRARIGGPRI